MLYKQRQNQAIWFKKIFFQLIVIITLIDVCIGNALSSGSNEF